MTVPFKKIAESLSEVLPVDLADDVKKNVRAMVESSLEKMDLVTREELEVQEKVLARTRSQLESLQQRVAELEDALKRSANPAFLSQVEIMTRSRQYVPRETVKSGANTLMRTVCVEIHLSGGLPSFTIVGLPEAAEGKMRAPCSALINSGLDFPARRIQQISRQPILSRRPLDHRLGSVCWRPIANTQGSVAATA